VTTPTITAALRDPNLFGPFLGDDLSTWQGWLTALRVLYGLPVRSPESHALIRRCTGRDPVQLPAAGFNEALFLVGRRSGKSRTAAVIGAYEAVLAGHEAKLARGERGVVAVVAPTKNQGRVVRDYLRAIFDATVLAEEVVSETDGGFELRTGTRVEVMAGHWRTVRGFTLLAAIVDELAFMGLDEEAKVRSDAELIAALRPGLATTGGKLVGITSPHARKGFCWAAYRRHWGSNAESTLVWNCSSRTMNPTLSQAVVDRALAEDLAKAKAEYLGEFRDDVAAFIDPALVERLVVRGRRELPPRDGVRYVAFVDPSGGRGDEAALCIAHREGRAVVIDLLRRYPAPHDPHAVVTRMVAEVRRFGCHRVTGDNYAAEWVARAFAGAGVAYTQCDKARSALYLELLPRLCSGEVELPDDPALVAQLAGLERRTRSGGKDVIDHPPGGHDDLANAVAGAADAVVSVRRVGGMRRRAAARFTL
jgi:hypothetical protein